MNYIIAYGGFSDSYFVDLLLTYKFFIKNALITWGMFIIISEFITKSRIQNLCLLAVLIVLAVILPAQGVMGELGPAHIAADFSAYSSSLGMGYFLIKFIMLTRFENHKLTQLLFKPKKKKHRTNGSN